MGNEKIIWDEKSEATVLATLISHMDFFIHCDFLKPDYFYDPFNKSIYWALQTLFNSGVLEVDALNIENVLTSNKGVKYIIERSGINLNDYIQTSKYVAKNTSEEFHLFVIKVIECAYKRELLKTTGSIQKQCYNEEVDINTLEQFVNDGIDKVSEEFVVSDEIIPFGEVIDDVWEEICSSRTETGLTGLPSKIDRLNEYVTYEPGELVLLAARMKKGKSVFLMNETLHKLRNSVNCVYFDTEMSDRRFLERVLANLTGIDIKDIKSGKYTTADGLKIKDAMDWLRKAPLVHKFMPLVNMNEVYATCKILKNRMDLQFVIYDYIKDTDSDTASERYAKLGQITDVLKNKIATDMNLAVLAAAQLNRQGDLADSDLLARYASTVLLYGDKTQTERQMDGSDTGTMKIDVLYNRNGEVTDEDDYIDIVFEGSKMRVSSPKYNHMECREQPFDDKEDKK